jgi:hypothetical protein
MMSTRINARSVEETLREHFKDDAVALKDIGIMLSFAAIACGGEPFSLLAGVGLITNTAGAVIEAGAAITRKFFKQTNPVNGKDVLPKYERFRSLFYISCMRSYIESLPGLLKSLKVPENTEGKTHVLRKEQIEELRNSLQTRLADLDCENWGHLSLFFWNSYFTLVVMCVV